MDNDNLTVFTHTPDVTNCFQNTVLTWIPCGFLWLVLPVYALHLSDKKQLYRWKEKSLLNWMKMLLSLAIVFLQGVVFFKTVHEAHTSGSPSPVYYVTPLMMFVTFITVTILQHIEFSKGVHTSGVLLTFWTLVAIAGIISFRSQILQKQSMGYVEDMFRFVIIAIYFGITIVEWTLSLCVESKEHRRKYSLVDDEKMPLLKKHKETLSLKIKSPEPSPEISANVLSAMFYAWTLKFIIKGYRNKLTFDDVYASNDRDKCETIVPAFLKEWRRELTGADEERLVLQLEDKHASNNHQLREDKSFAQEPTPDNSQPITQDMFQKVSDLGVTKALIRTFKWHILKGFAFRLFYIVIAFFTPLLLRQLLNFLTSSDPYVWKGYIAAVLLGFTSLANTIMFNRAQYHDVATGIRMRTAIQAVIYRKALRLSTAAKRMTSVGQIVTLVSIDAERLVESVVLTSICLAMVIMSIIATAFIWQIVGAAALAGFAVLVLGITFNGFYVASKIRNLQLTQMMHKDQRLNIIGEILSGIKVLKFYAWEPSFLQKVQDIRNRELKTVKYTNYWLSLNSVFSGHGVNLIYFAIIMVYMMTSEDYVLTTDTAFVTLSVVNLLSFPITMFIVGMTQLGQTAVAVVRINDFLKLEEVPDGIVTLKPSQKPAIRITDGYFSWNRDDQATLKNINLSIAPGSLVAVVGQVGSGKSSVISSMLGEMVKISGCVTVKGTMSYAPQEAWIQNDSLRGNILFGKPYNKATYEKILDACAMTPDLKLFSNEDLTEIGEKGANLSGGQRQRLSIARAVYQDQDIYLLDDPLSAVDANVGKHIFQHVIGPTGILKHKTRVLATHHATYLPEMDKIIVMRDGEISELGTYEELMRRHGDISGLLRSTKDNIADYKKSEHQVDGRKPLRQRRLTYVTDSGSESSFIEPQTIYRKSNWPFYSEDTKSCQSRLRRLTICSSTARSLEAFSVKDSLDLPSLAGETGKLIDDEQSEGDAIKWHVIGNYIISGGTGVFFLAMLLNLIVIVTTVCANIWLSKWTNDPIRNGTRTRHERDYRLGIYGGLLGGQILISGICFTTIGLGCAVASGTMHKKFIERILHAPMSFFDTTPLGRILNRMSKDMDGPDNWVPLNIMRWMASFNYLACGIIIVGYTIPLFLVAAIPLTLIYILLLRLYARTLSQLRRNDSVRTSLLLSHLDESIVGATSIRAYRQQDRFIELNDLLVENCSRSWYLIRVMHRFLIVFGGLLGTMLIIIVSCFAIWMRDSLTPGIAGLTITYTIQVDGTLNTYMWTTCELEVWMVLIERIFEYCTVEQEADWEVEETMPNETWPSAGTVEYRKYNTRYRKELDLVLRDISFKLKPGEKVGVVGRTGAGKSSLTLSLFRIIEASGGAIYIDGIEIASLGLRDLRSRLAVIPQDPVIFSGSLRFNLDPLLKQTDRDIWEALSHAHMKRFVASLPDGLDYECGENGEALSIGQRQLVCLARALLRKSKVLVLDEATAAVDLETDVLIQETIRTDFADRTIITVAHRLNTILDYDRVMVLDRGRIIEMDSPQKLMNDNSSVLHGMAIDAGII